MATKLKPYHLTTGFVIFIGLIYKLFLPSTPHDSVSVIVQPLFYFFMVISIVACALVGVKVSFEKREIKFIILITSYYVAIFLSTWVNLASGESRFAISDFFRFLVILAVCFSGLIAGKFAKNNEALKRFLTLSFILFLFLLLFKAMYENGISNLSDKRPFTLQNSFISLVFLYFLSQKRVRLHSCLVIATIAIMFFLSGSRSVLVTALIVCIIYFIKTSRGNSRVMIWLLFSCILTLLFYLLINHAEYLGRFSSLLLISEDSRFLVWDVIYRDIASSSFNWIVGRGFVDNLYFFYYATDTVAVNTPHNTYLYLIYYSGIIGLLLGLVTIYYSVQHVELIFKIYLIVGFGVMLFNDSLFFPHSFSYIVDYWFFYFFLFYFWCEKSRFN